MALREAKCRIASRSWAGQLRPLVQRRTASSSSRSAGAPQTGQASGSTNGSVPVGRRSGTTRTTSGITSPARCTITESPTRTSLRVSSSWLCNEARDTVTPPTVIGSRSATGVNAPVRPT